jgi:hypothetical protein
LFAVLKVPIICKLKQNRRLGEYKQTGLDRRLAQGLPQGKKMQYEIHDLVGNLGVLLILASYLLVQLRRLDATGLAYVVANGLGAAFILYSLIYDFNLSAFIIEIAWILISLVGLARIYMEKRAGARHP